MIFASMYRYTSDFIVPALTNKLKDELLSVSMGGGTLGKMALKAGLKSNFDITDEQTLIDVIQQLDANRFVSSPIVSILIKIYLDNKDNFTNLSAGYVHENYLNEDQISEVMSIYHKNIDTSLSSEDKLEMMNAIQESLEHIFGDDDHSRMIWHRFFGVYENLLPYAQNVGFSGFDYARIIDLIGRSYNVGYINDEQALKLLRLFGPYIENLYGSWEVFLSSAILGKQYMMFDGSVGGMFIKGSAEYISDIYGLITAPSQPLLASDIWADSDFKSLEKALETYVDMEKEQKKKEYYDADTANRQQQLGMEKKSVELYERCILDEAVEHNVTPFLDVNESERSFKIAKDDMGKDDGYFWLFVQASGISFGEDEVPFFYCSTLTNSERTVFTNKAIYLLKKKMFRKLKIDRLSWTDPLHFEAALSFSNELSIRLNGHLVSQCFPDFKQTKYSKAISSASTKAANAMVAGELRKIEKIFSEIKNKL
ncbi:Protein of unknown function [Paenibacillus tianmuensis]|uniref:DUF1266 domain-containing protein n=1 Tax=Paenibacillus tianmuensis TaxID=624147 RepID=A0A1G4SGM9_9BACL|nr:DUF1266 domain-containing protein [Paenibacillus tianmuensis]SCW68216.1 Protein of unknown function [Paenibacillus tianmuensis]